MTAAPIHRHPAGTPIGGRFAPTVRTAADTSLAFADEYDFEAGRPDGAVELYHLPTRLSSTIRAQVPDAAEVRFEVYLAEVAPGGNPMAAYDVPALEPEEATIVDSKGNEHTLQMPETGSREYYQLLADLDDAAEAAREEGQALHEGDTAFYTL